jgi:hypothetical protein
MSSLHTIAGQKFYIGTTALSDKNSDFVAADFSAIVWTEVDGWKTTGRTGDTASLVSIDLVNRARTVKGKGPRNGGQMQNAFAVIDDDPGQLALVEAEKTQNSYPFRIKFTNQVAAVALTGVSMTAATPGVATKTAHGLVVNTPIKFTAGSGTLPTGVVDGTTYYVKTVATADTFTISATAGGTAITTTGSPSGTYTVTTVPAPSERLFIGLVMSADDPGGEAAGFQMVNSTIEINSNLVDVARVPAA